MKELFDRIIEYCHNKNPSKSFINSATNKPKKKQTLKESLLLLEGQIKSICLSPLSSEFKNVSAQDAVGNSIKAGYVYTKWLWISRKRFLVLKGNYLYWFRDEESNHPEAFIYLSNCRSITTDGEKNSFFIKYLSLINGWKTNEVNENTLTFYCFDDEENCIAWKIALINRISEVSIIFLSITSLV